MTEKALIKGTLTVTNPVGNKFDKKQITFPINLRDLRYHETSDHGPKIKIKIQNLNYPELEGFEIGQINRLAQAINALQEKTYAFLSEGAFEEILHSQYYYKFHKFPDKKRLVPVRLAKALRDPMISERGIIICPDIVFKQKQFKDMPLIHLQIKKGYLIIAKDKKKGHKK